MKILTKTLAIMIAAVIITLLAIPPAEAGRGRRGAVIGGIALGAIGLGIIASEAERRERRRYRDAGYCYEGPKECRWVRGYCDVDEYGDRYCVKGHRECRRPTYCD